MENVISVFKKEIPVKTESRDITELKFWKENPRVNSIIKRVHGTTEITDEEIEEILTDQENVRDLFQKIRKHGGLIDEILVKDNVVLEGNSRLCAYRMHYKKALETKDKKQIQKWKFIRCRVLPSDTNDETIFTILGTYHIDGKKQWNTFEKIAYLKRMKEIHNYSSEKVAEIIHASKKFVDDNIEAHDLMVDYDVYDLEKFSYFIEMVKNRAINDEQSKDNTVRPKIIEAIKNGQFNRANEMRDVPKVLKDKVARRLFFEDGDNFADALEMAKERNPQYDSTLYAHLKKTTEKLKALDNKKAEKIKKELKSDANKKDIIRRFEHQTRNFCKKVGITT